MWRKKENVVFWFAGCAFASAFFFVIWLGGDPATLVAFGFALLGWGSVGRWLAVRDAESVKAAFEHLSMVDETTGALSKKRIIEDVDRELRSAKRKKEAVAIVLIEATNIVEINQTFDRKEGDAALRALAIASKKSLRDTDYIGRLDGLVLCALLPETDLPGADFVMERVRCGLSEIVHSHQKGVVLVKYKVVLCLWDGEESCDSFLSRGEKLLFGGEILESQGSDSVRSPSRDAYAVKY